MNLVFISIISCFLLFGLIKIIELILEVLVINGKEVEEKSIFDILTNSKVSLLLLVCVCIFCFFTFPYVIHKTSLFDFILINTLNESKPNEIGDTFGGTLSPLIAFFGAILTYLAFYSQFKANENQRKDLEKERFENKFFELLKLHKSNVDELSISKKIKGRECFIYLFKEYKLIYETCQLANDQRKEELNAKLEPYLSEINFQLTNYSFKIFFFGVRRDSKNGMDKIIQNHLHRYSSWHYSTTLFVDYEEIKIPEHLDDSFKNFDYIEKGRLNQLGHYYRHLFQTVKYVVNDAPKNFRKTEKLKYLSILRAQLSNDEILLLYYNAVSGYGKLWFENGYFTDYKMLHNLPIDFANFGVQPMEHPEIIKSMAYWKEQGQELFEWHENK